MAAWKDCEKSTKSKNIKKHKVRTFLFGRKKNKGGSSPAIMCLSPGYFDRKQNIDKTKDQFSLVTFFTSQPTIVTALQQRNSLLICLILPVKFIEHFHSRDQWPYWFTKTKRKCLHKKERVQFWKDWFGTPIWLSFLCFGTPIWPS